MKTPGVSQYGLSQGKPVMVAVSDVRPVPVNGRCGTLTRCFATRCLEGRGKAHP